MTARAIMSGAVGKTAELRTSKNGTPFATLSIRENVNGATRWWQSICFSESAIEVLMELSVGEPIAVAGEISAEIYAPAGTESRINWRITVDCVLSARKSKAKREEADPKPKEANGRNRAEASNTDGRSIALKSWAAPTEDEPSRGSAPFMPDRDVPFSPERR
jgi:single-stranded DNA-binding protein